MILKYEWQGLKSIISGGQYGSDLAGLACAKLYNVKTGGFAPAGYRTCRGPNAELKIYGLSETISSDYKARTSLNIAQSDATLILASNFNSPGTRLTINKCKLFNKQYFLISLPLCNKSLVHQSDEIFKWIVANRIETLNVAGNRDKLNSGDLHFNGTMDILNAVLGKLNNENLLIAG